MVSEPMMAHSLVVISTSSGLIFDVDADALCELEFKQASYISKARSYLKMTTCPNVVVISIDDGLISAITVEETV